MTTTYNGTGLVIDENLVLIMEDYIKIIPYASTIEYKLNWTTIIDHIIKNGKQNNLNGTPMKEEATTHD